MRGGCSVGVVLIASAVPCAGGCGDDGGTPSTGDTTSAVSTSTGVVPPATGSPDDGLDVTGATGSTSTGEPSASSSDGGGGSDTGVATIGGQTCGDGRLDAGEECDDGNPDDGDTCSASCTLLVELVWTDTYDGPGQGFDEARAVVVDIDDSLWVLGRESVANGTALWLRHYAADGTIIETFTWSAPTGVAAGGDDLTWTDSGDLAIAGFAGSVTTGADILVAVFDPDIHDFVWTLLIDGPGSGAGVLDSDSASSIAIAPSGHIIATGQVAVDGEGHDLWVAAFDAEGGPQWAQTWSGPGGDTDRGLALVVADDGSTSVLALAIVDGFATWSVLGFGADGTPSGMPMLDFGDPWQGETFAPAGGGEMLVEGANLSGAWIWRVDAQWNVLGQVSTPMFAFSSALAVGTDRIYSAGQLYTAGAPDAWVGAFDEDGILVWSDAYDHPEGHDQDGWNDVAVDSAGDVIVVGRTQPVEDGAYDLIVRKYHPL